MLWGTSWLEEQCAAAIEADALLGIAHHLERFEELRQVVYIQRYGEDARKAKIAKSRHTGHKLWL